MMLIEQTTVPAAALPLSHFKAHLRLGTGFVDDGTEDELLETLLRTAIEAVEARISKSLLIRSFTWVINRWQQRDRQTLPIAPVMAISAVRILDRAGTVHAISTGSYRLEMDLHAPALVGQYGHLPTIPDGGSAEIDFDAGFAGDWSGIPSDLAHAVVLLAAQYYEHRTEGALAEREMPFGVAALLERWRRLHLSFGDRP